MGASAYRTHKRTPLRILFCSFYEQSFVGLDDGFRKANVRFDECFTQTLRLTVKLGPFSDDAPHEHVEPATSIGAPLGQRRTQEQHDGLAATYHKNHASQVLWPNKAKGQMMLKS